MNRYQQGNIAKKLLESLNRSFKNIHDIVKETQCDKRQLRFVLERLAKQNLVTKLAGNPVVFRRKKKFNENSISRAFGLKIRIKEKRENNAESFELVEEFHQQRSCKSCQGRLEKSRWWNCFKCQKELPSDAQDDFIYTSSETRWA